MSRTLADVLAGVVAVAIVVIGSVLLVSDGDLPGPTTKTTVSKEAVAGQPGITKTTTVVERTQGEAPTRTTTTEVQGDTPAKPAETTTTTEEGQRTFLERVLGDSGLVVLQLAAVVIAAFLVGAIVQRVLLGEYGGFKFGNLELTAVARASTAGIGELKEALQKLRDDAAMDEDLKSVQEESQREDAAANRELALALKRMDLIEKRLDQVGSGGGGSQQ